MSRLVYGIVGAALLAAGCYQDDSNGPANKKPMTAVFVTDAPFPFDSVQSVNVYIVSIAVSTQPDTGSNADNMQWVTVAEPHRQVNLLALQQGFTDSLGAGELPVDQYRAVRVVIDADSSQGVRWADGSAATVRWNGAGRQALHAFVEAALAVPDSGARIVIDFDVGRSFAYNNLGDRAFDFFPWIRAVNAAATGSIAGTVQGDSGTGATPVVNATVSAWGRGGSNWFILSTGKTDAAGRYRLAYLLPGTYIVGVDPPSGTRFGSALDSNVAVNVGVETTHDVSLSPFTGAVYIQGAASMLVNQTNPLEAIVIDAQHHQDTLASVAWQNLDTTILGLVVDSTRFAHVTAKAVGTGRIVAASGALADTLAIAVYPDSSGGAPVRR